MYNDFRVIFRRMCYTIWKELLLEKTIEKGNDMKRKIISRTSTPSPVRQEYPHLQKLLFWGILLFAFVIRIVALTSAPSGVNQDEAMAAVDAWALSKYGTDRFGMQLPVHFTAWGYGQMSVLLSYCMVPFIWLFGFSTFAIRLPMVLASVGGVALVYLISKKLFSGKMALAVMAFCAINPWHFMQSRWSLDCNLFPHVFLLAFYLLLLGLEKRKYLYLSMVFFGLTFYCYGVAVYTVPVFLLLFAIWCLSLKIFSIKDVLIAVIVFIVVALPEVLVMLINMFGWDTIETPLFTMAFFPDSIRSNDILLLNFSWESLCVNANALYTQVFLQKPDALYNALPDFGPMYHISTLFVPIGIGAFIYRVIKQKDRLQKTMDIALLFYFIVGIWTGLTTHRVNINRINIIFYALIFMTVYGMYTLCNFFRTFKLHIAGGFVIAYTVLAISFFTQYFKEFPEDISVQFHRDLLEVIEESDKLKDYDVMYVSSHVGWFKNWMISEILTQYICELDAHYCQGLTNETGGRKLLPYRERYRFVSMEHTTTYDATAIYIMHRSEYDTLTAPNDVILQKGDFVAVDFR